MKPKSKHISKGSMKTKCWLSFLLATVVGFGIQASARAEGKFHFPVGITYSAGAQNLMDKILDAYEADWEAAYGVGIDTDRIIIPVGLTLNPYYEWSSGFGVGLSVGPTAFVAGSLKYYGETSSEDTKFSFVIPVGADVRYTFLRDRKVSPYVRAGVRYPIAGGDNIDSSQVGPFGAIGLEFWRNRKVGMGLEVGYDASSVKVEGANGSKRVTFAGLTAGLSVVF